MRTKHDLEQALRDLQGDDANLMSRDDVQSLLAAHPIASQPSSATASRKARTHKTSAPIRQSRTPWIVGAGLAIAATVAFVFINTSDTEHLVNVDEQPSTTQQSKDDMSGDVAFAPKVAEGTAADNDGSALGFTRSDGGQGSSKMRDVSGLGGGPASPPIGGPASTPMPPPRKPSSALGIETMTLAASQLAPLGLEYRSGRIVYTDDGVRVTIRANGVAAIPDQSLQTVSAHAPLMVVVYHDEKHFSSWWDKTDTSLLSTNNNRAANIRMNQTSFVDGLVAIRVPLDASGTLASKADVVLWFAGTKELAERLPEPYKTALLRELGIVNGSTTTHYTEPDLGRSTLVEASLVFPNPLRSGMASVRLQMKRSAVCTGTITDMFGKEIAVTWKSQSVDAGQTDLTLFGLDNAPTGVYNVIITFEGSTERIVQRLMIQR